MTILSTVVGLVADSPAAPVPIVERLRVQLAEAEASIPVRREALAEAHYQIEVTPGPEAEGALSLAQAGLDQATGRADRLRQALSVAIDKAAEAHADATRAEHTRHVKALEQRLKSARRHAKSISAHLDSANRAWMALLQETEEISAHWPKCASGRMPAGHANGLVELHGFVRTELARLVCAADPASFSNISQRGRHFLGTKDDASAQIAGLRRTKGADSLPSMESRMLQAGESLLRIARANPPPAQSVAPVVTPRMPAAVWEPGQQVKPADVPNLERLKAEHAAQMAEMTAPTPPPWDASDLQAQKAEYFATAGTAEPPPDGEELAALAAEWNANNSEDADDHRATNEETTDVE